MEVEIQEVGPCRKTIKVVVPSEAVDEEFNKNYSELSDRIDVPGFRKGRAPRRLLQRRFGKQVEGEVKQNLIGDSFRKALEENKLKPVMLPEFDPEGVVCEEGQPLTFEATVEVRPEIQVDRYTGIEVERRSTLVSSEEVDAAIERLRAERAEEVTAPEDATVERGDILLVDLLMRTEGEEEEKASENVHLRILPEGVERGHHDFPPDDFVGSKRADVVRGELPGHSHGDVEHPGHSFEATIKEIKREEKPSVDDEFASEFGFEEVAELRERIEEDLLKAKASEEEKALLERIIDQIIEANSFELPESYVQAEAESSLERLMVALHRAGFDDAQIAQKREELIDSQQEQTIRDVKKTLILDFVAEAEGLQVSEDEVDAEFESMAAARGRWPSELRQEEDEDRLRDHLRADLTAAKASRFLTENAKISEAEEPTEEKASKKKTKETS